MEVDGSAPAFYRAWIGANAFAEAVGLGTTIILGWRVGSELDRLSGFTSALAAALLAIVLGTVLEGVVVGAAQELVLRRRLTQLRQGSWTVATAIGAALAWVLGMVPSTVIALTSSESTSQSSSEPTVLVTILLGGARPRGGTDPWNRPMDGPASACPAGRSVVMGQRARVGHWDAAHFPGYGSRAVDWPSIDRGARRLCRVRDRWSRRRRDSRKHSRPASPRCVHRNAVNPSPATAMY